jgi:hypothetical protein
MIENRSGKVHKHPSDLSACLPIESRDLHCGETAGHCRCHVLLLHNYPGKQLDGHQYVAEREVGSPILHHPR